MATPIRKRIVTGIGFAALASVAAATVILSPGLERRYHLFRLERDPALFEAFFLSPSEPRRRAAIDSLRHPPGQEALLALYVAEFDRCEPSLSTREQLLRMREDPAQKGVIALWEDGVNHQNWRGTTGHSSYSMSNVAKDSRRRKLILEHLGACVGRTFQVKGIEGIELQLRSSDGGMVELPVWTTGSLGAQDAYPPGAPSVPVVARFACFFRVAKGPRK